MYMRNRWLKMALFVEESTEVMFIMKLCTSDRAKWAHVLLRKFWISSSVSLFVYVRSFCNLLPFGKSRLFQNGGCIGLIYCFK